eukprot:gene3260-3772_t
MRGAVGGLLEWLQQRPPQNGPAAAQVRSSHPGWLLFGMCGGVGFAALVWRALARALPSREKRLVAIVEDAESIRAPTLATPDLPLNSVEEFSSMPSGTFRSQRHKFSVRCPVQLSGPEASHAALLLAGRQSQGTRLFRAAFVMPTLPCTPALGCNGPDVLFQTSGTLTDGLMSSLPRPFVLLAWALMSELHMALLPPADGKWAFYPVTLVLEQSPPPGMTSSEYAQEAIDGLLSTLKEVVVQMHQLLTVHQGVAYIFQYTSKSESEFEAGVEHCSQMAASF